MKKHYLFFLLALLASCKILQSNLSTYDQKVDRIIAGDTLSISKKIGYGHVYLVGKDTLRFRVHVKLPEQIQDKKRIIHIVYMILPAEYKTPETEFINALLSGRMLAYTKNAFRGGLSVDSGHLIVNLDIRVKKEDIAKFALISHCFK